MLLMIRHSYYSTDNLKVTVCLRVNIVLTFDSEKSKWVTNSKSFQIELVSFKGPYGMTKRLVLIEN